jgi:uncharacterized membrane protein YgcG
MPTKKQHRAIEEAVHAAEAVTGLQLCVFLGHAEEDARAHAEGMFTSLGLHTRPGVLVLVAPPQRRAEIVTSAELKERVSDEACDEAMAAMIERFRAGDLVAGIRAGLDRLVAAAGPGEAVGAEDVPDVIDEQ